MMTCRIGPLCGGSRESCSRCVALWGGRIAVLFGAAVLTASTPLRAQQPAGKSPVASRLAEASRALSAGDTARALEIGAAYLKQHPADAAARVLMARAHMERNELDAAYEHVRRALRTDPRNVDALYYLGLITGRMAQAEFQRLFAMAPDSPRVHQLMAESLEAQERRTEAEAEYEAALKGKPDLLDALLGLARLKRIRLECDGAIELYTRAEAIRPTFDGAYGLGTCYLRQQENEAALARFQQAVDRNPRAAVAWVGLGSALLGLGRASDAIARLQHAIQLEPGMSEAHYVLGRAYQAAGDTARAQEAFAHAERLRTATRGKPPDPSERPPLEERR
jgi:tetratricopeptide (TPR) repeat protein